MKEVFFILLVLLVLAGLTVYRYRRQIMSILEFWRTLQTIKGNITQSRQEIRDEPATSGPLVLCAKCGTWVPEETAVKLGRSSFYCSTKCLEASVKAG